ncbi:zinc ribbon domain-containing protein [Halorubrum aethiopicum]|uniref:zinc ribbon domain-containing protein n=1 Tax=Halorubrum aethiopicum TaxID=1758255 RepID=UPI000829A6FA|nr:zinc ribbon domain-containing protein [Halorubrum aethiopicum]
MPSEPSVSGVSSACPACGESVPAGASFCPDCGVDIDASLPARCPDCEERFADDDRFCSNCGAARSGSRTATSTASESRRAPGSEPSASRSDRSASRGSPSDESQRAFRWRVQEHLDAGWEIERDDGDRVVLVDRGIGSAGVHVLLFLTTGGIGNVLYAWWHYSELAERLRLVRGDSTTPRPPSNAGEGTVETVSAYLLSGLLLLIGGWIAAVAAIGGSSGFALIGIGFALLGAGTAPPVRRRLKRRHGLAAFGRLRTVDHRVLRPTERVEEPCVVCGEAFDRGLVRRRRDETVVAGVPLLTHDERYNHYCAGCAREELFGPGEVPIDDATDIDRETAASDIDRETAASEADESETTEATQSGVPGETNTDPARER